MMASQHLPRSLSAPPAGGALVLGGNYPALGIVRSLGRRSIPVWITMDERRIARFSRYARRSFSWPEADERLQLEYVLELACRHRLDGWAVFPSSDLTAALVARHHATLAERFRLTIPPWDMVRWAYDKRLTYQLAGQLGLECPWTYYPETREEVAALDCPFPVILKPAVKERDNPFTRAKAWRADDRRSLLARYDEARTLVDPDLIMLQEWLPGGAAEQCSFAALCSQGHPLAYMLTGHTRQYPVDFGYGSTYVETIDRPEIEGPARRLFAAMGYTGLAEIEFKRDRRTGQYKIMDVNARTWGSHALGQRAGVDFPYLVWRLIHGEPVSEARAQTGVRWVYVAKDLIAGLTGIRRGTLSPTEYLRSLRPPLSFAIFAWDDPLPAFFDAPELLMRGWRRGGL